MTRSETSFAKVLSFGILFAALALSGCSTLQTPQARHDLQASLIRTAGWQQQWIHTDRFDIAAAFPTQDVGDTLVVYLEGDGHAYLDRHHASLDPTPINPVALRMALADERHRPIAYLARPCQYALLDHALPTHGLQSEERQNHARNCAQRYWTNARYAAEIVASIGQALDQLKQRSQASGLMLIGYSGGGALAVLLAEQRTDVLGVVTVAGTLDLAYWTRREHVSSLHGSLDPATQATRIAALPQLHFAGGKDHVVGPDVTRAFLRPMPPSSISRLILMPDFDHTCCWAEQWANLLQGPEWSSMQLLNNVVK